MAKRKKSTRVQIKGIITRADVKKAAPFDPYIGRFDGNPTQRDEFFLDIALDTDEGMVYMKTPRVRRTAVGCGSFAIITHTFPATGPDGMWFQEENKDGCEAHPGKPATIRINPLVRVGDVITVDGILKKTTTSKRGKKYRVLNRVKKV